MLDPQQHMQNAHNMFFEWMQGFSQNMGVSATLESSQVQSRRDAGWTVLNKGLMRQVFMGTCDEDHCGLQNDKDDPESSS